MTHPLLMAALGLALAAGPTENVVFFDDGEPGYCHERSLVTLNTPGGFRVTDEAAFQGGHSLKVAARFTPEQRTVSFFWAIPDARVQRVRCRVRSTVPAGAGDVFLRSALAGGFPVAGSGADPGRATVWGAWYGTARGDAPGALADLRLPDGAVVRAAPLPCAAGPADWTTYEIALPQDVWPAPPQGAAEMVCDQVWVFLEVPVDSPLFGRDCVFYLDLLEVIAPPNPAPVP